MGTTDHDTRGARSESGTPDAPDAAVALATGVAASDHPLGSHAAQILATEHWSLLAARTLIWNEAMSRANVFLTVLSAAIIALALLADATGFGPHTTTLNRSGIDGGSDPWRGWSHVSPEEVSPRAS